MPPPRRLTNLLALAVLGVLAQRPMHPYEIATTLRDYGKDTSFKIKWGSLYSVVQTLEKRELIAATATARQGGRPERTIYALTETGRTELADWLRELISVPEHDYPRFEGALSLLAVLPPDEVGRLLQGRLRRQEGALAAGRASMEHYAQELPRLLLIENEYHLALLEAEVRWLRAVVEEFTAGTFPGLAEWRHYHETGTSPALGSGPPPTHTDPTPEAPTP